ncbi:MAG TPA: hypothetical protein VGD43_11645 [Micromonospora sp.]
MRDGDKVLQRQQAHADGRYRIEVPSGEHTLQIDAAHYAPQRRTVHVDRDDERISADAALATGALTGDVAELAVVTADGGSQVRSVRLTNTGTRPTTYRVAEAHQPGSPGAYAQDPWTPPIVGTVTVSGIGVDPTTGNVWLGDTTTTSVNEFRPDGTPTGRVLGVAPAEDAAMALRIRDLTYDTRRNRMCGTQVYELIWGPARPTPTRARCSTPATCPS